MIIIIGNRDTNRLLFMWMNRRRVRVHDKGCKINPWNMLSIQQEAEKKRLYRNLVTSTLVYTFKWYKERERENNRETIVSI